MFINVLVLEVKIIGGNWYQRGTCIILESVNQAFKKRGGGATLDIIEAMAKNEQMYDIGLQLCNFRAIKSLLS